MMDLYQHAPLSDPTTYIRLLILEKGIGNDPLRCSVEEVSLEAKPAYEAISYVWGSKENPPNLQIRTANGLQRLPITQNLRLALVRFRHPSKNRRLWTDAVCINQKEEDPEKDAQVGLMGTIYSLAEKVLIYLGEPDPSTSQAVELMEKIHEAALISSSDDKNHAAWVKRYNLPSVKEELKWHPLKVFLCRPWFRRKWTIQECALALDPVFYCGDWERPWKYVNLVYQTITERGLGAVDYDHTTLDKKSADELNRGLAQLRGVSLVRRGLERNVKYGLMDIAYLLQSSEATDSRDHLFALLAIAFDGNDPDLRPRYLPENTLLRNCVHYARHLLTTRPNLEVLCRAGVNGQTMRAPSWVPNWYGIDHGFGSEHNAALWDPLQCPPFYNVSHGVQMQVVDAGDDVILGIKGCVIDRIVDVANKDLETILSATKTKTSVIFQKRKRLSEYDKVASNPALSLVYPEDKKEEAFWRTLICNVVAGRESTWEVAPESYYEAYKAWRRWWSIIDRLPGDLAASGRYTAAFKANDEEKVIGVTANGYMGMFPKFSRQNDLVVVLYGGRFPFVLRPYTEGREGEYELVGQCYIHGVMEPGTIDLSLPKYREEIFYLGGAYQGRKTT